MSKLYKESQTIELKKIWKDEYLKTICAFANTDGGILYIWILDDGSVYGVVEYENLLETLPNKINNRVGILVNVTHFEQESKDIIEGNLIDQVDKIMDVLRVKYLKVYISYEGMHRREKLEYPYEALREVVINALIHRDYTNSSNLQIKVYDDKLVMYNGVTLSSEVPIEKFDKPHQSKPFNPTLANVFYKCGFIENWGRGTLNITKEELAKKVGKSRATITRYIQKLKEIKKLNRVGSDRSGYWEVLDAK